MKKINWKSFIAGAVTSFVLIGSVTAFAGSALKTIQVAPGNFKAIMIDGQDKTPPADKQPFVYNNTTYVPLRYIAESMYKNVTWEKETNSIVIDGVSVSDAEKKAVFDAIELNFKHANDEDMEAYMDDFSSSLDGTYLDALRAQNKQIFDAYNFKFTLIDKEITDFHGNSCEVRIVIKVEDKDGTLPGGESTQTQKLVKENGKWMLTYNYVEK